MTSTTTSTQNSQSDQDGVFGRIAVEYRLTDLGFSLAEAFCGVWLWAEKNLERIEASRASFDAAKAG